MNPTYDFKGQVAVITGAGSGMGLAAVKAFAEVVPPSRSQISEKRQ